MEMRRSRPHPARMRSERPRDVRSPEADDVAGGNPLHGFTVRPADQGAAVASTRARSAPDVPESETPTRLTVTDRVARGRAARAAVPRSAHGEFGPSTDRFDPIAVLRAQDASRVTELVPIRYGRMAVSPFTFFRGAAAVMAADLAETPVSGARRPALRRRAPVELRVLRFARAAPGLRPERLRRDVARSVGMGRQAACCQCRDRRPQPRIR